MPEKQDVFAVLRALKPRMADVKAEIGGGFQDLPIGVYHGSLADVAFGLVKKTTPMYPYFNLRWRVLSDQRGGTYKGRKQGQFVGLNPKSDGQRDFANYKGIIAAMGWPKAWGDDPEAFARATENFKLFAQEHAPLPIIEFKMSQGKKGGVFFNFVRRLESGMAEVGKFDVPADDDSPTCPLPPEDPEPDVAHSILDEDVDDVSALEPETSPVEEEDGASEIVDQEVGDEWDGSPVKVAPAEDVALMTPDQIKSFLVGLGLDEAKLDVPADSLRSGGMIASAVLHQETVPWDSAGIAALAVGLGIPLIGKTRLKLQTAITERIVAIGTTTR